MLFNVFEKTGCDNRQRYQIISSQCYERSIRDARYGIWLGVWVWTLVLRRIVLDSGHSGYCCLDKIYLHF
jgi:hypothetical protein